MAVMPGSDLLTVRHYIQTSTRMVFSVSLTVVRACATVLLFAAGVRRQRRAARVSLPSAEQPAHFWARGCTPWPLLPQHPHPSSLVCSVVGRCHALPACAERPSPPRTTCHQWLTECPRESPCVPAHGRSPDPTPRATPAAGRLDSGASPGLRAMAPIMQKVTTTRALGRAVRSLGCCAGSRSTGQRCCKKRRMRPLLMPTSPNRLGSGRARALA
jgi:hypothetical protein